MARPLDSKRIVAEILAGQHEDAASDILAALLEFSRKNEDRVRWKITWPLHDLVVTEDDLTVEECLRVEKATGVRWHQIDPIDSVNEAAAILSVALSSRRDLPLEDATKQVGALGARQTFASQ